MVGTFAVDTITDVDARVTGIATTCGHGGHAYDVDKTRRCKHFTPDNDAPKRCNRYREDTGMCDLHE